MSQKPDNPSDDKKTINNMDLESLIKLINIAYDLKKAFSKGTEVGSQEIVVDISLMAMLFEYMVLNLDEKNIDPELIEFLEKILGIKKKRKRKKELVKGEEQQEEDLDLEPEETQEVELSKEEKERRYRLAMYEIYKILNPRQLAGETSLENFVNNVKTRGVEEAMKYEGAEHAKNFNSNELENLESHKFGFVQALEAHGAKGGGRGL
ncbi:hypothetical protein NF27_FX00080 [Candidatus Jidaibacter acanthamoeba]|uniref:Uncharacterized protein n=1 Tax=Candidatus Jidaibacter acanthamoebae TaxID=86105 RepID=A0A0C1MRP7_9RICK|nr:DUF5394 family protein [Candidatus Jidaibacter acanthamoeba]KIE04747.1 hypothetical protein NF27_FX00080 [Candidatus Jidaibacter acanthamoeba]